MGPRFLALCGVSLTASACVAPARTEVIELVARVDEASLRDDVESLCAAGPRPADEPEAVRRTLDWLRARLEPLGLEVREERGLAEFRTAHGDESGEYARVVYGSETHEVVNLVVELPGEGLARQIVEVGAHYDTAPRSPGADDNASGVVALLELARLLADRPRARTVRLVFFGAEERGLKGSTLHARAQLERTHEWHVGAIVLDMIGFALREGDTQRMPLRIPWLFDPPTTADFILVAGNYHSGGIGNLFEDAADRYVPELEYYSVNRVAGWVSDGHRSDHASYWRAGLRAIQLGDSADQRSPHYHRASDTPETLDYRFLADVTRALVAAVEHWANP
jgi:Zn-dependent M28 family amino/carboxypeptidase